jgi:DNA-binding NtrC family response regulator
VKLVLYVGCPEVERSDTQTLLSRTSLSVVWAGNLDCALLELQRCDMPVIVDLSCGANALQIAREIRHKRASTLMFAVADVLHPDLTTEAVLAGMADVFTRPLAGGSVTSVIERELGRRTQTGHRPDPTGESVLTGVLYDHSPAMRAAAALVAQAATTRAGVLIRGENGSGRRVIARAIHAAEAPSGGAFVTVDCAACDADRLEAELFGTGTEWRNGGPGAGGLERVSRTSCLHEALGGTLCLGHVAEASTDVQTRLARILRDRRAIIVEAGTSRAFHVRPVAVVEPGFEGALQDGRIRDDLFRRLSAIVIDVPPLRNRREDVPALANYFMRETCASLCVRPKTFTRPALSLLSALPWRGNAVELRTLLERVVEGLGAECRIGLEEVLAYVRLDEGVSVHHGGATLKQARARFEREYITAVLRQHRGRVSETARTLGIQRTNLYRKLRSLGVVRYGPE